MLFAGQRYAAEVYPEKPVWGYSDLAEISFGVVGKVIKGLLLTPKVQWNPPNLDPRNEDIPIVRTLSFCMLFILEMRTPL